MLAQEEARELYDRETGSQHLLLGVLQAAGEELSAVLTGYGLTAEVVRARLAESSIGDKSFDEDADALSTIGIDLRAVRDSVARTFGADAFDNALSRSGRRRRPRGHISFSHGAKKAWSWHCEKHWRTRTTRSAASTFCWASCEVATKRPSA